LRILFVTLGDSVHAARWIRQLKDQKWDIHVFPHSALASVHPELQDVTVHNLLSEPARNVPQRLRQTGLKWPFGRGRSRVTHTLQHLQFLKPPLRLARAIRKLKPDFIHVLEMQRAGYLALDSFEKFGGAQRVPPVIYSSWGSDIFHFGRRPDHEERIKKFLGKCDYLITDCRRDVGLARKFGFTGEVLGLFPVGGGFDIDRLSQLRSKTHPSSRTILAVKGYDGGDWGGRAAVALEALRLCSDQVRGYKIVVYSGSSSLKQHAEEISASTGLTFNFLPRTGHNQILSLFGHSRLAIGLGVTDGTPNSMLEAMIMGAFPIQSNTVSTSEWIKTERNGLLVPAEDAKAVAAAIRHALSNDELVDRAAELNARITRRVDQSVIQPKVIRMYEKLAAA
jgi:glycosyltransferase involved in cell wall biosynthesis